jgi:hypothetical protein
MADEYITIKELEKVLNSIPMVNPNYIDMVSTSSVIYYVKEFMKSSKYQRKRKIEKLNE